MKTINPFIHRSINPSAASAPSVRLLASAKSWIEGEAVRQLYAVARLEGVRLAVGFPDLHPGKGSPVGAAFVTTGVIYPHIIGGDVGCGMALFKTNLVQRDLKLNRWADLRFDLEHPWEGDVGEVLAAAGYLRDHDLALRWAKANRALIARRFVEALGAEAECLWNGCHNSISRIPSPGLSGTLSPSDGERDGVRGGFVWVHRKGAVAVEREPAMIPGSRGSLSYLVKPIGDGVSHAWSLAHGAGRRWARSESRLRMRERFGRQQLTQAPLGGRVICEPRELLYEEAPAAYKNIEDVVQDLVDAGLISVIAAFRPLLTYKARALRR
jgi:release factor H-coupled RctB family protein